MDFTKRIEELEVRVSKLEALVEGRTDVSEDADGQGKRPRISVVEFLREKKPVTSVDKALVLAVYHENLTGKDVFNTEDLLALWRQAKEARPSNINDLINKNIKKGYIAEENAEKGQKKNWYVTTSGNEAVEALFQKK